MTRDELKALAIKTYLESLDGLEDVKKMGNQRAIESWEKLVRGGEQQLQKRFPEVDLDELRKANNR